MSARVGAIGSRGSSGWAHSHMAVSRAAGRLQGHLVAAVMQALRHRVRRSAPRDEPRQPRRWKLRHAAASWPSTSALSFLFFPSTYQAGP